MLVEFRVTNYRSFHTQQVLSMVAAKDTTLQHSNCIESGIAAAPTLLRSAVCYGPNAGGKSNLIMALAFMRSMVETSAISIREGQLLNVSPFRLDLETAEQPTEFEITFVENGIRFQYSFTLTSKRITHECLLAYIGRKAQRWFEREYDNQTDKDHWYFGSHLLGGNQRQLWKESTRANTLFLSTAVHWNSDQLRPIFNWFVNKLVIISGNVSFFPAFTIDRVNNTEKTKIVEFLQAADLDIADIKIEMRKAQQAEAKFEAGKLEHMMPRETELPVITLLHRNKNNQNIAFDFLTEESEGTRRLFAYADPILNALQHGHILVVDELDNSLHTKMVRFIISLIHNPDLSKNNAQLIFSTHDASLLDAGLFRRDQIWFVEKDKNQASKLYPLTDFSPRKDEALEKGYLMGRYGALPFFGEWKF